MQQTPAYILPLADDSVGLAEVGGKGASLARLAAAGLPVPLGFHITTAAYRRFVAEHGLQEQILSAVSLVVPDQPATLEQASSHIERLFEQNAMPPDIANAVRQAYSDLGGGDLPVAVRSPQPPKTCPRCRSPVSRIHISTCAPKSGCSRPSNAADHRYGLRGRLATGYGMASRLIRSARGVVQALVPADAAGILFTVNPLTGASEQVIINAA